VASFKRDEPASLVLKAFAERKANHEKWCEQVAANEKAYLAVLDSRSQAAQWTSKLTPPYAQQVVDTVVANLIDDRTRFMVRPRPGMTDPETVQRHIQGAKAHELLLSYQMDRDRYTQKKAAWILQGAIAGLSVMKVYWRYQTGPRLSLQPVEEPVYNEWGELIGVDRRLEEVEQTVTVCDDPCVEPVKIEDFLWEDGALDIQSSPWLIHRVPMTMDELEQLQQAGVYRNVDKLKQFKGDRNSHTSISDEFNKLDTDLQNDKRFKDRVEILEYWCRKGGKLRCITLADRAVVLADREHLFWHGEYPFVGCTTRPRRFQIPGRSIVESIRQLQEYLWTLINQRLDNLALINNAIYAIRDDIIDRDSLEWYPGAIWPVPGDVGNAIAQFSPDIRVAEVSLNAEAMLKGDLQNVTGGMPFMSGTDSSTIDQKTATGVSIITSLAQKMVASQKQYITWAEEQIGNQMMQLNQQFVRAERLIPIIGRDGAQAFEAVEPEVLQGTYHVNLTPATESLMRQERRAEAQAALLTFTQVAPIAAAMGAPLNPKAFIDRWLDSFEIDDTEQYYASQPQPQIMGGAPGQPGGQPSPDGGTPPQGVTAPQAYDPTSPSNANSMSGEAAISRLMAMAGGPNNV
jgi:hypothetical protein